MRHDAGGGVFMNKLGGSNILLVCIGNSFLLGMTWRIMRGENRLARVMPRVMPRGEKVEGKLVCLLPLD